MEQLGQSSALFGAFITAVTAGLLLRSLRKRSGLSAVIGGLAAVLLILWGIFGFTATAADELQILIPVLGELQPGVRYMLVLGVWILILLAALGKAEDE